jgi:hypothetical protein
MRSAHDALQVLVDETCRCRRRVVKTDIAEWFSAIPHHRLMRLVEERLVDEPRPVSGRRSSSPTRGLLAVSSLLFFPCKRLAEMLPNRA